MFVFFSLCRAFDGANYDLGTTSSYAKMFPTFYRIAGGVPLLSRTLLRVSVLLTWLKTFSSSALFSLLFVIVTRVPLFVITLL